MVGYGAANDNDIIVTPKFIYAKCQTTKTNHTMHICVCAFASASIRVACMVQQHGTHFVIVYRILLLLLFCSVLVVMMRAVCVYVCLAVCRVTPPSLNPIYILIHTYRLSVVWCSNSWNTQHTQHTIENGKIRIAKVPLDGFDCMRSVAVTERQCVLPYFVSLFIESSKWNPERTFSPSILYIRALLLFLLGEWWLVVRCMRRFIIFVSWQISCCQLFQTENHPSGNKNEFEQTLEIR